MQELISILSNLIAINAVEHAVSTDYDYLKSYLEPKFEIQIIEKNNVANLLAIHYGQNNRQIIDIAFIGHLDVVPIGDKNLWFNQNPFQAYIHNNHIYGRGAVDMKSSIAAFMLAAMEIIKADNCDLNIAIILTGDEETDSQGAKDMVRYLQNQQIEIKNILIGEPTSENSIGDIIKNGRRGSANFDLIIYGMQGHAAYPEKSINPIALAIPILNDLTKIKLDYGNQFFQPSQLVITNVSSNNPVRNIIPNELYIKFNIRYNNQQTIDSLQSILNEYIVKYNTPYNLTIASNTAPFICEHTKFSENLKKSIFDIAGIEANYNTNGGTSDGRFFHEIAPIIEFGPLNATAHKINEYISFQDLENLYKIYKKLLSNSM